MGASQSNDDSQPKVDFQTDKTVVIYGEDYCPFCQEVKTIFQRQKIPFEYKDRSEHQQDWQILSKQYSHSTIPMVFCKKKFIGGCSETKKLLREGKLKDSCL